jgi:hypothetical protein
MCGLLVVFIFWGGFHPDTFLKPMESSVAATRGMALNPANQRPLWADDQMQVNLDGKIIGKRALEARR